LTRENFERVLGIQKAKEHELSAMREAVAAQKKRLMAQAKADRAVLKQARQSLNALRKSLREDHDRKITKAKADARRTEREKAAATIKRLDANLRKAQIENQHLKNQSEVGRAWDGHIADFIRGVFGPLGDHVETTKGSRSGDVIVNMRHNGEIICPIIVENKTGLKIEPEFIRQASRAKRERKARYALLVCDGKRRGFEGGIKSEGDVLLVKPAALITLLHIIREAHVDLARSKASHAQIDQVSRNLLAFVTSQDFRTPLESVLKAAGDLETHLVKEKDQMQRWWTLRLAHYRQICVDSKTIRSTVNVILERKCLGADIVPMRRAS
jgi:hypothetical protein